MYKILVVSDSHGRNENIRKAVERAREIVGKIDAMFHLGDVGTEVTEAYNIAGVATYIVRGNNDFSSELKAINVIKFGSHTILATHGHMQQVSFTTDRLRYLALENGCDIALFGHTHMPYLEENEDVTILNPGSLTYPRQQGRDKTFAIITIADDEKVSYEFYKI